MKAIVCITTDYCIGRDNDLLYKISEDLRRFKSLTSGGVVYMGGNTWKSLPEKSRPLKDRINVVLTDEPDLYEEVRSRENSYSVNSMSALRECFRDFHDRNQWIIGGASMYAQAIDAVDEVYFTEVQETGRATDVKFPVLSVKEWDFYDMSEILTDEKTGVRYKFRKAVRK